jgi:hypothetical protein
MQDYKAVNVSQMLSVMIFKSRNRTSELRDFSLSVSLVGHVNVVKQRVKVTRHARHCDFFQWHLPNSDSLCALL